MCTVSIIRLGDDLIRLACNRDEQLSRPLALPPRIVRINGQLAVMPIDPTGGGTWIAANEAGVMMALLNRNSIDVQQAPAGLMSRGRIIPILIGCSSAEEAIASASKLDARAYGPFRMALIDRYDRAQVISDGFEVRVMKLNPTANAVLFTSSGLGDDLVEGPRRALFDVMMRDQGMNSDTQDRYHRHRWPEREHLSLCMRRSDAKTVSHSIIELGPEQVDFRYHAAAPDEPGLDYRTTIPLLSSVQS